MITTSKASSFIRAVLGKKLHLEFEMIPLELDHPSRHQLFALASTELSRLLARASVFGPPSVLQLEPASMCNLSCPLCPSGRSALSRLPGMMSLEQFNYLLEEIGRYLSLLILWGWGEPLLNPELPEMISSAKRFGTAVVISTNGQLMTTEIADKLVASGLDAIIVALDGATEASYQSYRIGGSLQKGLDALDMLHEAKLKGQSSKPIVNLRMIITKDNEHEVPLMRELALEHHVDMLTLRGIAMTDLWDDEDDSNYVPSDSSRSLYQYSGGKRVSSAGYVCRRPWKRATVASDGSVVPCEMDYSNSKAYGVLSRNRSFRSIWNGNGAREFRQVCSKNRMSIEFCARCPYNDRVTRDSTLERYDLTK